MNDPHKRITAAVGEFLFLSLLAILVPLILSIDILIVGHGVQETSVTEWTQEALLLACVLRFALGVWCRPRSRGFLILVVGFFCCILIRELDAFFDNLVFHGFWVWPAMFLALGSLAWAIGCRETILTPLANFVGTRSYFSMLIGLVLLLAFSRSFGSGGLLWKEAMGDGYSSMFKAPLQEGLELLAYLFLTYGAFLLPPLISREDAEHGLSQRQLPQLRRLHAAGQLSQRDAPTGRHCGNETNSEHVCAESVFSDVTAG